MRKKVYVINLRGEKEPFSFKKVYLSALNAGAPKKLALQIAYSIQKTVSDGTPTSEIFQKILQILSENSLQSAIKFNLKRALENLGPTGFPFEKFISKIFEARGFKTFLNQIISGYCTHYEIDFLAEEENTIHIVECKYHRFSENKVDLQTALANYARFIDIKKGNFINPEKNYKSVLVTNTKFTTQAIEYSKCVGVNLWGWKYPENNGLEKIIEENSLYPITILPSLNQTTAKSLIEKGFIMAKDILKPSFLKFNIIKKEKILKEAKILLSSTSNKENN
jgi:Holliday junction resolvase